MTLFRKLKNRFVILAMVTLWILLLLMMTGLNLINLRTLIQDADSKIDIVRGFIPEEWNEEHYESQKKPNGQRRQMEIPYEVRFFTVTFDETMTSVLSVDTSHIYMITEEDAIAYGEYYLYSPDESGLVDWFRFRLIQEDSGPTLYYLDCGRQMEVFLNYMHAGIAMLFVGLIIGFVVIYTLSGRLMRPIAESYTKQKQFITDAGHEIKTPLTIINANLDILAMESEDTESIDDIRQQVIRLRSLTDDLVLLSRMEESEETLNKIDFPVSDIVSETAKTFHALAAQNGLTLRCLITPMLSLNGNSKMIEQLTNILLENAVKYSAPGGEILLELSRNGKTIDLAVTNPAAVPLTEEQLEHLFDRFYRSDSSRNSGTGGHGIGLSVAQAIVTAHGGEIRATCTAVGLFRLVASFPS